MRIKCLLCKYEGLHSNLQVPHNPDVVSHVSNSSAFTMRQELETGEAVEATAQLVRDPVSKKVERENQQPHTHTHTPMHFPKFKV